MTDVAEIARGLRPHEEQAIHFLYAEVEHEMGELDTEPKLAAAMCFCDLAKVGVIAKPVFPVTRLTPLGLAVAAHLKDKDADHG